MKKEMGLGEKVLAVWFFLLAVIGIIWLTTFSYSKISQFSQFIKQVNTLVNYSVIERVEMIKERVYPDGNTQSLVTQCQMESYVEKYSNKKLYDKGDYVSFTTYTTPTPTNAAPIFKYDEKSRKWERVYD